MNIYLKLTVILLFTTQLACTKIESQKKEAPEIEVDTVDLVISEKYSTAAAKIDSFFKSRNRRGLFNGTVLFAEKGSVVYKNAFGFA